MLRRLLPHRGMTGLFSRVGWESWPRFWRSFLLITVVFLTAGCGRKTQPQDTTPSPPEVFVTEAIQEDVPISSEWIGTTEGNYQVAVVGPDNRVAIRSVKVGEQVGKMSIIEEGLKPGERVVVAGLQKVQTGTTVNAKEVPAEPNNTVASASSSLGK